MGAEQGWLVFQVRGRAGLLTSSDGIGGKKTWREICHLWVRVPGEEELKVYIILVQELPFEFLEMDTN